MNLTPKVSVVMAFRNSEKFINLAIESILKQSLNNFELILIDDASTDKTKEMLDVYLSNSKVSYIRQEERKGKSYNLNLGIKIAKAELIAIMDGDDISENNRLKEQVKFLEEHSEIAVVGSFAKIINENGDIIDERTKLIDPDEIKKNILIYGPLIQPSVMFRKKIIQNLGGYRGVYIYGEDTELWYRIVYSGFKITNLPKYLLRYRYHGSNIVHDSKKIALYDLEIKKITIKNFKLKIGFKGYFFMYGQFLVEYFLSGRQRQFIEGTYKKMAYGRK